MQRSIIHAARNSTDDLRRKGNRQGAERVEIDSVCVKSGVGLSVVRGQLLAITPFWANDFVRFIDD
jgi:hypothetical protein